MFFFEEALCSKSVICTMTDVMIDFTNHRNEALRIAYIDEVETETGKGEKEYFSKLVKNDGGLLKDQVCSLPENLVVVMAPHESIAYITSQSCMICRRSTPSSSQGIPFWEKESQKTKIML